MPWMFNPFTGNLDVVRSESTLTSSDVFTIELEAIRSFRGYLASQTFDKVCRAYDSGTDSTTITFTNLTVFQFAIDITDVSGDWCAKLRLTQ